MSYIIKKELITNAKYDIKCPHKMKPLGICIHETYNDAKACNEAHYMKTNNNKVSFHTVIDEKEVIQCIPYDRNAWASGDGYNGDGNRNYIHIEVCYSKSGGDKYTIARSNAISYIIKLMSEYNFDINNIKGHCNFSSKNCPNRTNIKTYIDLIKEGLNTNNNNKKYRVIVGAYRVRNNADEMLKSINNKGFDGFINYIDNKELYRVISGSFKDKDNAKVRLNKLINKGYKDSYIVYE